MGLLIFTRTKPDTFYQFFFVCVERERALSNGKKNFVKSSRFLQQKEKCFYNEK